jgi:ATP-dependent protease HslVU (ClpYQ) peptidase subunit
MTTVAYRNNLLVSDSRMTLGSMNAGSVVKIGYHPKLNIGLGLCGNAFAAGNTLAWLKIASAEDLVEGIQDSLGKHGEAILVDGKRHIFIVSSQGLIRVEDKYAAIGSGAPYALAAMDAGVDAKRAVKIACKRDAYSGGKIRSVVIRG